VYGLIVLESGVELSDTLFHLVALVIVLSILAHSSTDVLVAKQFDVTKTSDEPARER
jgi:NhaP-type Na+/H+ or K+/H+ antiporter